MSKDTKYYDDYPKKPIGKGNPYWACKFCGVSDPEINGRLDKHASFCEYRIVMELKQDKSE